MRNRRMNRSCSNIGYATKISHHRGYSVLKVACRVRTVWNFCGRSRTGAISRPEFLRLTVSGGDQPLTKSQGNSGLEIGTGGKRIEPLTKEL